MGHDVLSLEIDVNLIQGETYEISYYDYSSDRWENQPIPIEIGLSLDSTTFGDSIWSSVPKVDTWTLRTFSFIAPNSGKYLTVRNEDFGSAIGWSFLDDFQLNASVKVPEKESISELVIFPTPCQNKLIVSTDHGHKIQLFVYDISSKVVINQILQESAEINMEQVPKGVYIYKLCSEKGVLKQGKLIKE